jgi:hypothetical protein
VISATESGADNESARIARPDAMLEADCGSKSDVGPKATPERRAEPPRTSRAERAEISRQNSRRSTGPRTDAGKAKSRYNALKHGMSAESILLPGESAADFEAGRLELHDSFAPRSPLEALIVDRIARETWKSNRAQLAADARHEYDVRHQPLDQALAQEQEAIAWSQLLLDDPFATSGFRPAARKGGPEHPAQLLKRLESTLPGCDVLLEHLRELEGYLPIPGAWVELHGFELARLMGRYVSDFASDYKVASVLLASQVVVEDTKNLAWAQARAETRARDEARAKARGEPFPPAQTEPKLKAGKRDEGHELPLEAADHDTWYPTMGRFGPKWDVVARLVEMCDPIPSGIDNMPLDRFVPDNAGEARRRLAVTIDEMIARLESIRAMRARVDLADAVGAGARLASEAGRERELERRYSLARDRMWFRAIDELLKVRKAGDNGTLEPVDPGGDERLAPGATDPPAPEGGLATPTADPVAPVDAEDEACPTSPTPEPDPEPQTSPTRKRGWSAFPSIIAALVTRSLRGETTCADAPAARNEASSAQMAVPVPAPGPIRQPPPDRAGSFAVDAPPAVAEVVPLARPGQCPDPPLQEHNKEPPRG